MVRVCVVGGLRGLLVRGLSGWWRIIWRLWLMIGLIVG
ncbi:hypothetical protein JOE69_001126 [Arthrobacter russicus]|uniref:Uncharacterized protein n=1 Tax=Arthrobacter russicus TaxID=172040 RepID=A0ABU1J940_9MICC|nr:hypothetical protein [Arthrobacter russicus]